MRKKQTSRTSPTNGGTTQTNSFAWSQGPTVFEYSSETHVRTLIVKGLRKGLGMSLPEISSHIGYSPAQILAFERGYDRNGLALPDKKWKRYIWALRGLRAELGNGKEKRKDAQGNARVQAREPASGHGETGQKGRQGHRPKAGDRHRFERGEEGRRERTEIIQAIRKRLGA